MRFDLKLYELRRERDREARTGSVRSTQSTQDFLEAAPVTREVRPW